MLLVNDAFKQHLDLTTAFLLAEKACLDDAGVVENQQVASA
jgi:hypothetical protein